MFQEVFRLFERLEFLYGIEEHRTVLIKTKTDTVDLMFVNHVVCFLQEEKLIVPTMY